MPQPIIDLTGRRFGRLAVVELDELPRKGRRPFWLCFCHCGRYVYVRSKSLTEGSTRSCGCLRRDLKITPPVVRTHGGTYTREYTIWTAMKARCSNPKHTGFVYYGGRGIFVCDSWRKDFGTFLSDMGPCPDGFTLERCDVNGPYAPENCRWASAAEQACNRRNTVRYTFDGKTLIATQWARELKRNPTWVARRLAQGDTIAEIASRRRLKSAMTKRISR